MSNDKKESALDNKLESNKEVAFLYKKCKRIRPSVISMLNFVPEYMEAIKSYNGSIDDEVLYSIIRAEIKKMIASDGVYRTARGVMNKISKDVKGDSLAWEYE